MSVNINKEFGVISVDSRYYFGASATSGKIYPSIKESGQYTGFLINIGGDCYEEKWSDLVIGGSAPVDFDDAKDLLQQIFS